MTGTPELLAPPSHVPKAISAPLGSKGQDKLYSDGSGHRPQQRGGSCVRTTAACRQTGRGDRKLDSGAKRSGQGSPGLPLKAEPSTLPKPGALATESAHAARGAAAPWGLSAPLVFRRGGGDGGAPHMQTAPHLLSTRETLSGLLCHRQRPRGSKGNGTAPRLAGSKERRLRTLLEASSPPRRPDSPK